MRQSRYVDRASEATRDLLGECPEVREQIPPSLGMTGRARGSG